jgi:hypothetical protein
MKYYKFNSLPIQAKTPSFLVGYNADENKKVHDANFNLDKFGKVDSLTATLKAIEDEKIVEFLPYLIWDSGRPEPIFSCITLPEIKTILDNFNLPPHKWYEISVHAIKYTPTGETNRLYNMLQIINNPKIDINYLKSKYLSINWMDKSDKKSFAEGEITSENIQHFGDRNSDLQITRARIFSFPK